MRKCKCNVNVLKSRLKNKWTDFNYNILTLITMKVSSQAQKRTEVHHITAPKVSTCLIALYFKFSKSFGWEKYIKWNYYLLKTLIVALIYHLHFCTFKLGASCKNPWQCCSISDSLDSGSCSGLRSIQTWSRVGLNSNQVSICTQFQPTEVST